MNELPVKKQAPIPVMVLLGIPLTGLAMILVVTSTAVAPSGAVLAEWFLSTSIVGGLAWFASRHAERSIATRLGISGGAAIVYLFVRITIALLTGSP